MLKKYEFDFLQAEKISKNRNRSHLLCGQENLRKAPLRKMFLSLENVDGIGLGEGFVSSHCLFLL